MYILLGDKQNITLGSVYRYLVQHNRTPVIWLDAQAIVEELIMDDFVGGASGTEIHWYISDNEITPANTGGILNMLDDFNPAVFRDFSPEDRDYARSEFTAYLIFALNQYKNVLNPACRESLSGNCQSLPYQWLTVRQQDGHIQVPQAYFGPLNAAPRDLALGYNTVVSGNIYNARYWRTGLFHTLADNEPYLVYRRPPGHPLVVTVVKDQMWVHPLQTDLDCQTATRDVQTLCLFLTEHFHVPLAEVLFFYDDQSDTYTFGSIRPGVDLRHLAEDTHEMFLDAIANALENA